jgi:phenylacetate-CoA ligase
MTDEKIMATIKPDGECWQPEIEKMPREQLRQLQVKKLKETINVCLNSPFYKKRLGELGITADSINTPEDIRKIPFTTKADLRSSYPFGLVGGNMNEAVRLHSSSGTTGQPTVVVYSEHDICSWANMIARNMYMVGCRKEDVFQNSSGYGMFTGGLGFQYGAEWLGCMTLPAGSGFTKRQIKFITDFGTTCLHAIPSYAIRLAEVIKEEGIDIKNTKLHTLFIGAEPHTEEQRRRIEKMLGVKAYNSFGMTEMNGPGVAFECKYQDGMHLWEDNYIVEIVDPDTLEPVPDGEMGEMVLTTLDRTMMPILRYRTRDLTRIIPGECKCGRTHRRIDRIKGRTDDMFIIKGVNVFPMQVEKILVQYPGLGSNYLITLETIDDVDVMTVEVELEGLETDIYPEIQKMTKNITRALKEEILLTPVVKLVKKGSLPVSEGKAVRVKDLRPSRG